MRIGYFPKSIRMAGNSAPSAPSNVIPPVVTSPGGSSTVGAVLSVTTGSWSGTPPITYSYQWQKDGSDLPGETTSTTDTGMNGSGQYRCNVTATNGQGNSSEFSNAFQIDPAP